MTAPRPLARVTHEALYLSEDGLAFDVPVRGPAAGLVEPPAPPKQDRIGALRLRDFRFLFIGTVTSGYGQWATMIGLGWLAYVLSGESAAQLAWVVAVGGAMRLVSAPWIGVVLDRYHRRSVTVWSTLASAALGLGLGVLVLTDLVAFWQLYVFSALEGIISSANQNVRQTFVYDVTTPDTLSNAIALNAIAQNLSRISGPPLAGAMIGLLGTASPFMFIAVMMLIATFFTLLISKTTRQAALDTDNPLRSLWVGLRYVATDRPMLGLFLSGAVPGIFLYPYIPLLPVFAEEVLNTGATGYGLLAASVGWGSLTGLLVLSWLGDVRRKGIIAIWGLAFYAAALIVFTQSTVFVLSSAMLVVAGVFHGVAFTVAQILVQVLARDEMRGRATSLFQMGFSLMPIGAIPMGMAIEAWGAAIGVGGFISVAFVWFVFMGFFWRSLLRA
ncbi:MAG: MFS transporter [Chloroflexi bacterium]|nr:MFS transporter [Chloroflexota bacterium]